MSVSTTKTKVMVFCGPDFIRTTIVVNGKSEEEFGYFSYFGNYISYDQRYDIHNKLYKFQMIGGIITRTLRNNVRRDRKTKLYKLLPTQLLFFGLKIWATTWRRNSIMQTSEVTLVQFTEQTKLNHSRHQEIIIKCSLSHWLIFGQRRI